MKGEFVSLKENSDQIDPPVSYHVPQNIHERILRTLDEQNDHGVFVPEGFGINNWVEVYGPEYTQVFENLNREHERSLHEQAVDSFLWDYRNGDKKPDFLAKGVFYKSPKSPNEVLEDDIQLRGHLDRDHWMAGEVDVLAVYVDEGIAELVEVKTSRSCLERDGKGDDQLQKASEILEEELEVKTKPVTVNQAFRDNTSFAPFYEGKVEWSDVYLESDIREFLDEEYFHIAPSYGEGNRIERRI